MAEQEMAEPVRSKAALSSWASVGNTLSGNQKLPKGKNPDQAVNEGKTKSVPEIPARSSELL